MKKFLVIILVLADIIVICGLFGLSLYQFGEILNKNNEIDKLNNQISILKSNRTKNSSLPNIEPSKSK